MIRGKLRFAIRYINLQWFIKTAAAVAAAAAVATAATAAAAALATFFLLSYY